jgi:hypothetical protein
MALELEPSIKSSDSGSLQDETPLKDDGVMMKFPNGSIKKIGK